jgi:hypothetical protein
MHHDMHRLPKHYMLMFITYSTCVSHVQFAFLWVINQLLVLASTRLIAAAAAAAAAGA